MGRFRRRSELEKFLAVAEAVKIVTAADRLAIGQPALTRAIAALENQEDFSLMTAGLDSVVAKYGQPSHTTDLIAGRIHGERRDRKSGRNRFSTRCWLWQLEKGRISKNR